MPDSQSSHRAEAAPPSPRLIADADLAMADRVRAGDAEPGVSLLWVTNTILSNRRAIFGLPLLLAVAVLGFTITRPRMYTASTSFTPRSTDLPRSGLGNIAAQFGVAVPGGDPSQSPDFYADLLVSRPVMEGIVDTSYSLADRGVARPLTEILEASGDTPAARREDAIRILKSRVSIAKNTKTGVIRVAVSSESPTLSVGIADRLLSLVNAFNLRTRQAKANDEAKFAETRVNELAAQLRQAENELRDFQRGNRAFRSPDLMLEEARLNRAVSTKQQLYTTMGQMYEQVRLDALRNTPVITVVEPPEPPARPDPRLAGLKAALAFVFGTAFMLMVIFAREVAKRGAGGESDDLTRFRRLRRDALADVRNPLRVVGAVFSKRYRAE